MERVVTRLLDVTGLSVHFPGPRRGWRRPPPVQALNDVSLHVDAGEVLGVVGESGSGKTTLGRAILGLTQPTGGTVHFDGEPVIGASATRMRAIRGRMQAVFQDPTSSLNPTMTIGAA
ncbi:peptide ABC transporter ATP-binding protein, partial [Sphingomonas sp. HMWF008]